MGGIISMSEAPMASNVDYTLDLIQRINRLSDKFSEIEQEFADIGPSMETIYAIRDQLKNIESRTITIVNQFQEKIYGMEDKADQIIIDLNVEVDRIEEHIDDLLGLAENFGDIADEIKELLQLSDKLTDLQNKFDEFEQSIDGGGTKVIEPGQSVPVENRIPGNVYIETKDVSGDGADKVYHSVFTDSTGAKFYFDADAQSVLVNMTETNLFQGLTNLDQVLDKIDDVLSDKVYVTTYYADLTADYEGESAPYTQTVSVPGLKDTDEPIVGLIIDDSIDDGLLQDKAYGNISKIIANENSITVKCYKKKPEVALKLRLVVLRTD